LTNTGTESNLFVDFKDRGEEISVSVRSMTVVTETQHVPVVIMEPNGERKQYFKTEGSPRYRIIVEVDDLQEVLLCRNIMNRDPLTLRLEKDGKSTIIDDMMIVSRVGLYTTDEVEGTLAFDTISDPVRTYLDSVVQQQIAEFTRKQKSKEKLLERLWEDW